MESTREKIVGMFQDFETESGKADEGNKSAGVRARKISVEIAKLFKTYRKETVQA